MHGLSIVMVGLVVAGIIGIGVTYLSSPRALTRSFGLPLPDEGASTTWWLRLKGVRDIVAGLLVLALMRWGGPRMVGIALMTIAIIPVGDMLLVLAAKGSPTRAGGHGLFAALMLLVAIPLVMGLA